MEQKVGRDFEILLVHKKVGYVDIQFNIKDEYENKKRRIK